MQSRTMAGMQTFVCPCCHRRFVRKSEVLPSWLLATSVSWVEFKEVEFKDA